MGMKRYMVFFTSDYFSGGPSFVEDFDSYQDAWNKMKQLWDGKCSAGDIFDLTHRTILSFVERLDSKKEWQKL